MAAESPTTQPQDAQLQSHDQIQSDGVFQDDMSDKTAITPDPEDQTHQENDDEEEDVATQSAPLSCWRGGGPKRKAQKRQHPAQAKKSRKLLQILKSQLKPIPFKPAKILDFASHEALLKRVGLWDFVHLQFDQTLRGDLIGELIANWEPNKRRSFVKGQKIAVSRADLGRALNLPLNIKKDSVAEKESEESIEFVVQVMNNYFLLHDDMWMMPTEVSNWSTLIKDGNFERVDWARMVWFMAEKELVQGSNLENCYYASHLQALIKNQKPELLSSTTEVDEDGKEEEGAMIMEIVEDEDKEVGEDCGDGDDNVRSSEDLRVAGSEMEEHNIELSLGGMDNNIGREDGDKEGKEEETMIGDGNSMDVEGRKEEDDHGGHWQKSSLDSHFLQRCNLGNVGIVECREEKQQNEGIGDEDGKEGEDDEEEEEEGHEEVGFSISPKRDSLDGVCSENLMAAMEAAQFPFTSGMQIHNNMPSGEFLASRVDTQTIPGSSSHFGIANKRDITHLDTDVNHHSLSGGNKRMRNDAPWEMKATSEFDLCLEQMQHVMGKAKMLYEAKEQALQEMSMNQQVWASQLQQRDEIIQHLHKAKMEEQQKRQTIVYRLERELEMMGSLLEGYRKALKETHMAFTEYRAKYPSPEQPIYKDAGPGGLVLSTMELEKQHQKREEEEWIYLLIIEKKIKEFEAGFVTKFESYKEMVTSLDNKLLDAAKEVNILKERFAKQKEKVSEHTEENVSKPEQ